MDLDGVRNIRARTQHFIYTLLGGNQTLGASAAGEPSFMPRLMNLNYVAASRAQHWPGRIWDEIV